MTEGHYFRIIPSGTAGLNETLGMKGNNDAIDDWPCDNARTSVLLV